jgi:hypothetical protein
MPRATVIEFPTHKIKENFNSRLFLMLFEVGVDDSNGHIILDKVGDVHLKDK